MKLIRVTAGLYHNKNGTVRVTNEEILLRTYTKRHCPCGCGGWAEKHKSWTVRWLDVIGGAAHVKYFRTLRDARTFLKEGAP